MLLQHSIEKLLQFNSPLITSAFAINEIQIFFTFTLVRAASVDALVELIRAAVQIFIQAFINI